MSDTGPEPSLPGSSSGDADEAQRQYEQDFQRWQSEFGEQWERQQREGGGSPAPAGADPSSSPPPPPAWQSPPAAPPTGYQQQGYGYGAAPPYQLASKGKRLGAALLEGLLVIVTLVIGWLVWSLINWGKGQSPAKQLLHMRVLKVDTGRAAEFGTMALREVVGKFVLGIIPFYTLISAIFVLIDDRSQGLWDKIAGTVVIDDPDDRWAPS